MRPGLSEPFHRRRHGCPPLSETKPAGLKSPLTGPMAAVMIRPLAIALAALAFAPAAAAAQEPVTSVSVTVEVGSTATTVAEAPEAPACELTMALAQRPLRWRKSTPVLAAGRTYRFAGRLLCDGAPAPAGTTVDAGEAGTFAVGDRGRINARVAYRGARAIEFAAQGATVRIAVRPRR